MQHHCKLIYFFWPLIRVICGNSAMAHRVHNNANSSLFFYTSLIFTSDVMLVVKIELRFITYHCLSLYENILSKRHSLQPVHPY